MRQRKTSIASFTESNFFRNTHWRADRLPQACNSVGDSEDEPFSGTSRAFCECLFEVSRETRLVKVGFLAFLPNIVSNNDL
jgi:hypothetical protein